MMRFAAVFFQRARFVAALTPLVASSCGGANVGPAITGTPIHGAGVAPAQALQTAPDNGLLGRFRHVVLIVQENRTPDDLFNGLPGADTVRSGLNSQGQMVPLAPISLIAPYDIEHSHSAFRTEYNGGNMNGFDQVVSGCKGKCPPTDVRAYGYVPQNEVKPYFDMAEQYAFADRMFQTNQGPSFPAHLYIIGGTAVPDSGSTLRMAENPKVPGRGSTAGCDSPPRTLVALIDADGHENQYTFPCTNERTIFDSMNDKGLTWRYYQAHAGSGLWNGVDAIRQIRYGSHYKTDVVYPPTRFYSDIKNDRLADLTIVTPTADNSDHAGITKKTGPSWVASIVNTIGKSKYWRDTAILVVWDDWGGWYDHVAPPIYNSYELGFRVPLVVISPFTPKGYVSHQQHEFGSILKFVEENFHVEPLGTTDVRADDLADCFDFNQAPRRFVKIAAPRNTADFMRQPVSAEDVDY